MQEKRIDPQIQSPTTANGAQVISSMDHKGTSACPLSSLEPGERGVIENLGETGTGTRQRLLEMGLVNGTLVEIVRYAPLGDPIELRVEGTNVSIRKREAQSVSIRKTT